MMWDGGIRIFMRRATLLVFFVLSVTAALIALPQLQKPSPMIAWSGTQRLKWDDFKAPLPDNRSADAETAVDIHHEWFCRNNKPHFTVTVFFEPENSWVDPEKKSDALLRHEQLHFDIGEVYGRILHQELIKSNLDCKLPQAVSQSRVEQIARDNKKEFLAEFRKYDEETQHGLNQSKQKDWQQKIKARLQLVSPH